MTENATTPIPTYQVLRNLRGRGTMHVARSLTVGQAIRVDGIKYRVQQSPVTEPTGSIAVEVYSEDNQFDTLYLNPKTPIAVLGEIDPHGGLVATPTTWKRLDGGYLRSDSAWFLVRGARMTHGANAWLIHRRVEESRVGRDASTLYDAHNGDVLWRITDDGHPDTAPADYTGDIYAHDYDAGWLSEAKQIVVDIEAREATR